MRAAQVFAALAIGFAAGAFVAPLAFAAGSSPTIPAPPEWSAVVDDTAGVYGQNLTVGVIGPSNGTFFVALSEPPANATPPVAIYYYLLPGVHVAGNATPPPQSMNASVPLTKVLMGALIVRVYDNATGTIATAYVSVLPPTDTQVSYLSSSLENLWVEYNATRLQLIHEKGAVDQASRVYGYTAEALVLATVFNVFFAVFMKTNRVGWKGWIRKARSIGHWMKWRPTLITNGITGMVPRPARPDPEACWIGIAFPDCPVCEVPGRRERLVAHLEGPRFDKNGDATLDHGMPRAIVDVDYKKDAILERNIRAQIEASFPSFASARTTMRTLPPKSRLDTTAKGE